jgi:hypothetical protein
VRPSLRRPPRGRGRPPRAPRRPCSSLLGRRCRFPRCVSPRRRCRAPCGAGSATRSGPGRSSAASAGAAQLVAGQRSREVGPPKHHRARRGRGSCMTARPVVDLPHPDSPTSPRVSPSARSKLMSDTAWTLRPPLMRGTRPPGSRPAAARRRRRAGVRFRYRPSAHLLLLRRAARPGRGAPAASVRASASRPAGCRPGRSRVLVVPSSATASSRGGSSMHLLWA